MNVLLLLNCLLLLFPGDVAGQFTAAPPTCPGDTFSFRCTVTGGMSGTTIWRVALGTTRECPLLHRLTSTSICGPNDAFTAASRTGFRTNGPFFTSTLSGTATPTLDGILVECFGPANNLEPRNRVNGSTLQILGPPPVPTLSCVDLSKDNSGAVNVIVNWTLSWEDSADSYLINITTNAPEVPYGGLLNITTGSVKLTGFMADYEYNITIRGVNCGSQEGGESELLTIRPQVPAAPTSCTVTLMYDQPSTKLQFSWDLIPDSVRLMESCQGPRGRTTQYQIRFQTGSFTDIENVNITACTVRKCSHAFNLSSNAPATYNNVSVAAVNLVGVGAARTCTSQTISTTNNLLTVEVENLDSPDDATLICTFLCGFTGSAHCQVQYGTDPTYMNLPYSAESTESGTAGSSLRVQLRKQLNSLTVYYYNVSAVSGDVTVVVQKTFTTPLYNCNETGLTDQSGMENRAGCADRGFVNSSSISGGVVCYNGTTEGSRAVYFCNDGFVLMGNEARVCQSGGKWKGDIPLCIQQPNLIVGVGVGGSILLLLIIILTIAVIILLQEKRREAKKDTENLPEDKVDHPQNKELHIAAEQGLLEEVKCLVKAGTDVNIQDDKGLTSLHVAIQGGYIKVVQWLVDQGAADVNIQDYEGRTPLYIAAEKGRDYTLECLVEKGAEIDLSDNNGMTPLHVAVQRAKIDIVEYLLNNKADVNIKDCNQRTPLHVAAKHGRNYTVECLLKHKAMVDKKDKKGMTSLHMAVEGGHIDTVKILVKHRADVNSQDFSGRTPLHIAAKKGRDYTVEFLVKQKAKMDLSDNDGMTPLHVAVKKADIKIVQCLVHNGADANICDHQEQTPLHTAAREGHDFTLECLVGCKKADIKVKNKNGMTPLHLAVKRARIRTVKFLVGQDTSVIDIQDFNKQTPLHIAAREGHDYTVEYLVGQKADINITDKNGMTPLHVAVKYARIQIVEFLTCQEATDVNIQDHKKWTPLHIAATKGRDYTVKYLFDKGANINTEDNEGMTPLHKAVQYARIEIVKFLVEERVDINSQDSKGRAPLHIAAKIGRNYTARYLVEHNANVSIKDNDGMTPLHMAVRNARIKVVKYLVEQGTADDVNIQDNKGQTPLHVAAEEGRDYTVEYLVENGANVNIKNHDGQTPLHRAAEKGHEYTMKCLVIKRANISIKDGKGRTPLDLAAEKAHNDIVKYLSTLGGGNANTETTKL